MILCLTSGFPYRPDPFLEVESFYHPKETQYFSVTGLDGEKVLPVPSIKNPPPSPSSRFKTARLALFALKNPIVREEIDRLKKEGRFSREKEKILLKAFATGLRLSDLLLSQIGPIPNEEPLIFYAYWMYMPALVGAILKKKFPRARLISRAHSYDIYEYRARESYLPFRKFIFDQADALYPISQSACDYLRSSYPYLDMEKVHLRHLGTLDKGINPPKKPDSPFRLVSCSSLSPVKRVDRILESLALLDPVPVEWIHFGSGEGLEELKARAREVFSGRFLSFDFRGQVPNAEIYRYYQENHVDLFLNASTIEGIPVSIMEALSFGIPVLATRVGGTPEIVRPGENGFLLEKDFSNEDYARAIQRALALSEKETGLYRKNARELWEKEFRAEKNYPAFVEENFDI